MTGITTGPRQFTLQMDCVLTDADTIDTERGGSQWHYVAGKYLWNTQKLDLRAFQQTGDSIGMEFLNISLQESTFVGHGATDKAMKVTDVITTVKPSKDAKADWALFQAPPGFMNTNRGLSHDQRFNPSQILWGLWRGFTPDSSLANILIPTSSSYFGEGEIAVAPHLYWTRIVTVYSPSVGAWISIPSANLVAHAAVVPMSLGQELAQMARAGQR